MFQFHLGRDVPFVSISQVDSAKRMKRIRRREERVETPTTETVIHCSKFPPTEYKDAENGKWKKTKKKKQDETLRSSLLLGLHQPDWVLVLALKQPASVTPTTKSLNQSQISYTSSFLLDSVGCCQSKSAYRQLTLTSNESELSYD